jgi:uncharacterized protein HemY
MRAGYNHPNKSYFRTIGRWASIAALIGSSILGCSKKPEKTPEELVIEDLRAKVAAQITELRRLKPFEKQAAEYKKQAEESQAAAAQQQEQLNQNQGKIKSLESEVKKLRIDKAMIEHLQKEFSELDVIHQRLQGSQQAQENLQKLILESEKQLRDYKRGEEILQEGIGYYDAKDLQKASSFFEKAVEVRGNAFDYHWLGATLSKLGDEKQREERINLYERAITNLEKVVEKGGSCLDYHWLGATLSKLGEEKQGEERINLYERAITNLEKAVEKGGNCRDYNWLGATLSRLGEEKEGEERINLYEKAIPILEQGVKGRGNEFDYFWLGATLLNLGDEKQGNERIQFYGRAISHLEKAVEKGYIYAPYWLNQAKSKLEAQIQKQQGGKE